MGNQGNVAQPKKEEEKKSDPPLRSQQKTSLGRYQTTLDPYHTRNFSDATIISDSKLHQ
jgi:hypothetical protein